MKYSYILLLLLFLQQFSIAQNCESERYQKAVFNNVTVTENITYGSADLYDVLNIPLEFDIKMNVYEPMGDTRAKRPVVFMSFGGAYIIGNKNHEDMKAWCDSLARYGYVAVSLDYRLGLNALSEGSAIRAMYRGVQDTRAAIRYMLEYQNDFRIDPEHIYLGGESAGAINSLHTAFMQEADRPQQTYGIPLENFDLGCLDCSGNNFQHSFDIAGVIDLWGAVLDLNYIGASEEIPTLIIHGTNDFIVPVDEGYPFITDFNLTFPYVYSSEVINQRMDALGIYNEYYPYQDQGHLFYGLPDGIITFPNEFWNPVWTQGHEFLYKTMEFVSPDPTGEINPIGGQNYTYSVPNNNGSVYCWEVMGGTVISDNGDNVVVQWDGGMGSISLTEENCIGVIGAKSNVLGIDATVGLFEAENLSGIHLFPTLLNVGENIFIESDNDIEEYNISIFDTSGKLIYDSIINNNSFISTRNLNAGLFIVKIKSGDNFTFRKIVIK